MREKKEPVYVCKWCKPEQELWFTHYTHCEYCGTWMHQTSEHLKREGIDYTKLKKFKLNGQQI